MWRGGIHDTKSGGALQKQIERCSKKAKIFTCSFCAYKLSALLFLLGAYAAIAVVFAAKTLTRYDKITQDEPISEYDLIGTLGSLLLAIVPTLILFPPR